jgi:hypothetical protein
VLAKCATSTYDHTEGADDGKEAVMLAARQGKQITVEVFNEIGVLHDIAKVVAEKGVNILGADADVQGKNAVIRLMTDDNLRAMDALRAARYAPQEIPIVVAELEHRPGVLEHLTERLGQAQIDIHHLAVTSMLDEDKCLVMLSCSDNDHAVVVLNA